MGEHPNIESLVSQLTLEEKVLLLAGKDFWQTHAIDRLNIPSLKYSDGPNGARGGLFVGGKTSACFPDGACLAATFDRKLVQQIGKALAEETRTKGASVLLGPTVCPHRDPRGGRNFESFSEDPFLAGELASEYILGLQGNGVGATIKHFAANEQETKRFYMDAKVSQHLFEVLRKEWGFKGLVMSDWGGTNSTIESINAGIDLEMPGPASRRTFEKVSAALDAGTISQETIDERVTKTWKYFLERTNSTTQKSLMKRQLTSLNIKETLKSVAVLGLGQEFLGHGGGSASVNAYRKITGLQGLQAALGDGVDIRFAKGASVLRNFEPPYQDLVDMEGQTGISVQILNKEPKPSTTKTSSKTGFQMVENPDLTSVIMEGTYNPTDSGSHYLSFVTAGPAKFLINDEIVYDYQKASADVLAIFFGTAVEARKQYDFSAGSEYRIRIEATAVKDDNSDLPIFGDPTVAFNLGFASQQDIEADLLSEAVKVAETSDVAIVFTGHTTKWETEGADRSDIALPMDGSLDKLISGCAAVNSKTIVANITGSPVSMPWLKDVAAVLQAFFPGQETGNSIADVLVGVVNPSGKLPVTFPKNLDVMPTKDNFPGDVSKLQVEYKEDILMGYRHYDLHPDGVLAPFGYGLSYTTFEVSQISSSLSKVKPSDTLEISAIVKNTGQVAGSEVVQCYLGFDQSQTAETKRPKKVLVGWEKIRVAPGQSEQVKITVPVKEAAQYWNESQSRWVVESGEYTLYVATSSAQADLAGEIKLQVTESREVDSRL